MSGEQATGLVGPGLASTLKGKGGSMGPGSPANRERFTGVPLGGGKP